MAEPARLRLVFEDAGLLRGWQRRRGLQRCWLQVRPAFATIADLASHVHQTFGLHRSCPHGLIVSMDGFVLPPFESTCILKDEDLIMIKKNGVMFKDVVKFCGSQNKEQLLQSRETSAFNNTNLAIIDPQVDSEGDEGDMVLCNEGTVHMETPTSEKMNAQYKRKHSRKLQGSDDTLAIKDSQGNSQRNEEDVGLHGNIAHKEVTSTEIMIKHKRKHSKKLPASDSTLTTKKSQGDSQGDEGDLGLPNGKTSHAETPSSEMTNAKRKIKHFNELQNSEDSQGDSPGDEEDVGLHNGNVEPSETPGEMTNAIKRKRSHKLQASDYGRKKSKRNDYGNASKNDANGDERKVRSRSARRKSAKRLWHRTHRSKKELIEIQIPESVNQEKSSEHANADQNTDVDKDLVRVIVRPGHIRFKSSGTCSMEADEPVETLQWNGTTSKIKGQKWGRENTFNKWNDNTSIGLSNGESNAKEAELVEVSNETSAVEEVEAYKEPIAKNVEPVKECCESPIVKEFEAVTLLVDFESLLPLIRVPEEGDILVYRVVELSSLWCPELSPFRVGRVSSYDCSSSKITLLPLPEYPLMAKQVSEEGQESGSLYKEDGTLEIDFPSLVDVRLFKAPEFKETTPNGHPIEEMQSAAPVNNQESASCSSNRIEASSIHTVNDQLSHGWEAINHALNEKKAQLQKLNDLDTRSSSRSTTTGPWSYRALRRNALGPTLAMLRTSNNGDTDE